MIYKLFPKKYTNKDLMDDFKEVFNTEQGKRVLKHLELYCRAFDENNPKGLTTQELSYNEGLRAVYLHIRKLISTEIITEVENDRGYITANTNNGNSRQSPNPDPSRR